MPDRTVADCLDEARAFFHLPPDEKRRVAVDARHRGFNAQGDALMYDAKRPDRKEFFSASVDPRVFGVPDAGCRYEPILAGDHILGRIERSFGYRRALVE